MKFFFKLLLTSLNVFLLATLLPGVRINHFLTAVLVAFALALLNAIVKPVLIFLTLPATIITLGLFLCVINACIILLDAWFVKGFIVEGFWYAMLFGICLSLLNSIVYKMALGEEAANE